MSIHTLHHCLEQREVCVRVTHIIHQEDDDVGSPGCQDWEAQSNREEKEPQVTHV